MTWTIRTKPTSPYGGRNKPDPSTYNRDYGLWTADYYPWGADKYPWLRTDIDSEWGYRLPTGIVWLDATEEWQFAEQTWASTGSITWGVRGDITTNWI